MQSHALVILFLFVTATCGLAAAPGIAAIPGGPETAGTSDTAATAATATTAGTADTAGPSSVAPFGQDPASGATPSDRRVDVPTAGDPFPARSSNHTTGSQTSSNTTTESTTNTTSDAPGNGTGDGPLDGNGTGLPEPRDPATAAVVWVGAVAVVAVGAFFYGRQRQP